MDNMDKIIDKKFKAINNQLEEQDRSITNLRSNIKTLEGVIQSQYMSLAGTTDEKEHSIAQGKDYKSIEEWALESWNKKKKQEEKVKLEQAIKRSKQLQKAQENKQKHIRTMHNRLVSEEKRRIIAQKIIDKKKAPVQKRVPEEVEKVEAIADTKESSVKEEIETQKRDSENSTIREDYSITEEVSSIKEETELNEDVSDSDDTSSQESNTIDQEIPVPAKPVTIKEEIQNKVENLASQFKEVLEQEAPFQLSISALRSLSILKRITPEYFQVLNPSHLWMFRLLFQLQGKILPEEDPSALEIVNQYLRELVLDPYQIEDHFIQLFASMDLSNENLDKAERIVRRNEQNFKADLYGPESGVVSLLIFSLREACVYAGIVKDSKTPASRRYQRISHKLNNHCA